MLRTYLIGVQPSCSFCFSALDDEDLPALPNARRSFTSVITRTTCVGKLGRQKLAAQHGAALKLQTAQRGQQQRQVVAALRPGVAAPPSGRTAGKGDDGKWNLIRKSLPTLRKSWNVQTTLGLLLEQVKATCSRVRPLSAAARVLPVTINDSMPSPYVAGVRSVSI